MHITVCIPVYNHDVCNLVASLSAQAGRCGDVDILCIDDCSSQEYVQRNAPVARYARMILLESNIGRARIRNRFLDYAVGDWLLFLDCDSIIVDDDFLEKYRRAIADGADVVCGGRCFPDNVGRGKRLRWKYGKVCENRSAAERCELPASFISCNFAISRDVLSSVRFDESISGYGHEDTMFGWKLRRRGAVIKHIDCDVSTEIEDNVLFLEKSRQGVENLAAIYAEHIDDGFADEVELLRFYRRHSGSRIFNVFMRVAFGILRGPIEWLLGHGCVIIPLFQFYKLGYFYRCLE